MAGVRLRGRGAAALARAFLACPARRPGASLAMPRASGEAAAISDGGGRIFRASLAVGLAAKGRPLFVGAADGTGPRCVTPTRTRRCEETLRHLLAAEMRRQGCVPFAGPVAMAVRMVFSAGEVRSTTSRRTGDVDNLLKTLLDAMTGTVLMDDRLVVSLLARKLLGPVAGVDLVVCGLAGREGLGGRLDDVLGEFCAGAEAWRRDERSAPQRGVSAAGGGAEARTLLQGKTSGSAISAKPDL